MEKIMKNNHKTGMTTHAGRSLLQEAARFSNEGKAVGEYVKNSWQYTDHDPTVEIFINQENKSIRIIDDSNGMDLSDCLALCTFEAIQLGIVITFINHTRHLRSLMG